VTLAGADTILVVIREISQLGFATCNRWGSLALYVAIDLFIFVMMFRLFAFLYISWKHFGPWVPATGNVPHRVDYIESGSYSSLSPPPPPFAVSQLYSSGIGLHAAREVRANSKKVSIVWCRKVMFGRPYRSRTCDTLIKSQVDIFPIFWVFS